MDPSLEAAFLDTDYVVPLPGGSQVVVVLGETHSELDAWVSDYALKTWCFITAWNPGANSRDRRDNARANVALFMDIQGDGHPAVSATARPRRQDWQPEPGFMVLGLSREEALGYAAQYGQLAVVFGEIGAAASLLWTEPTARP